MTHDGDPAENDKPRAELIQHRTGAGAAWWKRFFEKNSAEIGRRSDVVGVVLWTEAERMPIDLFSYIREASSCFDVARYLAAITMASCAIELILNRDGRTRRHGGMRRINGWATLNNPNLITAGGLGLPVQLLCSTNEQMQSTPPLLFVERRNRVANGDVGDLISDISDYDPITTHVCMHQPRARRRGYGRFPKLGPNEHSEASKGPPRRRTV
jgi:hypothetical protein